VKSLPVMDAWHVVLKSAPVCVKIGTYTMPEQLGPA
jgi:hypothetical protein